MQNLMRCLAFRNLLLIEPIWGYDFSSPNIASSSTTVFVLPANNVNFENNECKTDIASENVDKGK